MSPRALELAATCDDCGADTAPCTKRRGCRHAGRWEYYMVEDDVWATAGMPAGFLCIGCLEARLGRELRPVDFLDCLLNDPDDPWHTPRLAARLRGDL